MCAGNEFQLTLVFQKEDITGYGIHYFYLCLVPSHDIARSMISRFVVFVQINNTRKHNIYAFFYMSVMESLHIENSNK